MKQRCSGSQKISDAICVPKKLRPKTSALIEAGMDISLIPSRFEPAALNAMYN